MNSLYEISAELEEILGTIEENGGEVTEEELTKLEITQDNLKQKLTNYKNAILQFKNDIESIKCESKRLTDRKKNLENRINILNSRALFAVERFGNEGKTNKFIELSDARLYTKSNNSVVINEDRIRILINCIKYLIINNDTKLLNIDEVLDLINQYSLQFYNNEIPFTYADLKNTKLNISTNINVINMLYDNQGIIEDIKEEGNGISSYEITLGSSKTDYKYPCQNSLIDEHEKLTIAKIETNNSLVIK